MKQILIVFLSIILFTGCFHVWLPSYSVTTVLLLLIYLFYRNCDSIYKLPLRIITIGFLLSWISCKIYRGQSFIDSFLAVPEYCAILLYFLFKGCRITFKNAEKALVLLVPLYDVMFISQHFLYSAGINFMHIPEWSMGGTLRMRAYASGLYSIGIFLGLTKWDNTRNVFYLVMVVMGVACLFLTGYRQLFISLVITIFIYNIYYRKIELGGFFKTAFIFSVLAYFFMHLTAFNENIDGMIERNKADSFSNKIRLYQLYFYYNHYFNDYLEMFLGSGVPYAYSQFGQYAENVLNSNHVSWVDWGFLGQSWVIGVTTVIGYLFLSIKAIKQSTSAENSYVALWYIFLLLSVTNYEYFRHGNFYIHALALYIAETASWEYSYEGRKC